MQIKLFSLTYALLISVLTSFLNEAKAAVSDIQLSFTKDMVNIALFTTPVKYLKDSEELASGQLLNFKLFEASDNQVLINNINKFLEEKELTKNSKVRLCLGQRSENNHVALIIYPN